MRAPSIALCIDRESDEAAYKELLKQALELGKRATEERAIRNKLEKPTSGSDLLSRVLVSLAGVPAPRALDRAIP